MGKPAAAAVTIVAVPYAFQAKNASQLQVSNGANLGTLTFTTPTATDNILLPDASGTVCLDNSSACGFASASGSSNYIQNGTALQSPANFNIQSTSTTAATGKIEALASQTSSLLQFVASDGTTVLSGFNSSGNLFYQSGSFTGTLVQNTLGQSTAYHLPDPGAGTVDICLSTGNCAGSGSGITGSGTTNYVARFNSGSTINASSLLYDNNAFIGVNTTTANGQLAVVSANASQTGVFIQSAANATTPTLVVKGGATPGIGGDLAQFQNSTGTPLVTIDANGNLSTTGTLAVTGATTLSSTLGVSGVATFSSSATVQGAGGLTLGVAGSTTGKFNLSYFR